MKSLPQIAKDIGSLTYWEACLKYGDSPLPISHPSGKRCDRNVQADHVDSIFLKRQLTWRGTRLAGSNWQGHVYVKAVANHNLFVYTDNHSRLAEKALYLLKNNQDTKTVVFVKDLAGFDLLGNPPYINASSITLPPKAKSSSTPRSRHRSKARDLAGLEIEVDFSKPGLYYVKNDKSVGSGLLDLVNNHLPKLLNPLPQIVMIVPSKKDSFLKKAIGWKPLKDEMKSLALANLPEKVLSCLRFRRRNFNHGLSYDKFFECKSTKSLSDFAPTEKNESAYAILNQLDGLPEFNIQHQQTIQDAYSKLPSDLKLILNKHNFTPSEVTERFLQLIKEIP